jgi:flagellar basal body-associated protein FliL
MLAYICRERHVLIPSLFDSQLWGHTSSITDIIVRLCTVRDIQGLDPEDYKSLRQEILQHCVNSL